MNQPDIPLIYLPPMTSKCLQCDSQSYLFNLYNTLKKTKIVEFLTCIAANCLQQKEQVRNTRISNHDDGPINVVLWSTVCRRDRPYACMPAWLWLQGTSCQALVHQPTSSVVQVGSLFADVFFWSLLLHSGSLLLYSSIFVC